MKKISAKIILWILLFSLLPGAYLASRLIPANGTFVPDNSWTGVIRIWTCASSPFGTGSGASWLNKRAAVFEKSQPGVRIQIIEVSPEAVSSYINTDHPPDGLIFTPGTLVSASGLKSLSIDAPLRNGLRDTGLSSGERKAIPIAAGAYFWITASDSLSNRPGTINLTSEYTIQSPLDRADASYSAALLAMFTGYSDVAQPETVYPGADLGLPSAVETAAPTETPSVPLQKPTSYPEDFRTHASVRSLFTSGDTNAIIATPQELRRIEQLADSGKTPDYTVYPGGAPFTDLLAMAAVVDAVDPDSSEREQLCEAFFASLLAEESQAALTSAYAFRVTEGDPLYQSYRAGMAAAETALNGEIIAPNAFDATWRTRAAQAADLFISTDASAFDLLHSVFP